MRQVEIEHQYRQPPVTACRLAGGPVQTVEKQAPVGQSGQPIVEVVVFTSARRVPQAGELDGILERLRIQRCAGLAAHRVDVDQRYRQRVDDFG